MLNKKQFSILQQNYGDVSSWAIWERAGETPKSNTASMNWVNDRNLLNIIKIGYAFVGLNVSNTRGNQNGQFERPWVNFHSGYRYQNDYKLRFALQNTKYWGSYITDVIKRYPGVDSGKVLDALTPKIIEENIRVLENELSLLGGSPVLVAMGNNTHKILRKYLGDKYRVFKIPHYASRMSQETYRHKVLAALKEQEEQAQKR